MIVHEQSRDMDIPLECNTLLIMYLGSFGYIYVYTAKRMFRSKHNLLLQLYFFLFRVLNVVLLSLVQRHGIDTNIM